MNASAPSELQLDALREVANVGCGHAASALSQLVGGRAVRIQVPRVIVTSMDAVAELLGGADASVVAASLRMEGELSGHLLLVMPEVDGHQLCQLLLRVPSIGRLDEAERSALGEVANILASACLSAMGELIGIRLVPSVPTVSQDGAGQIVQELGAQAHGSSPVVVLEARFEAAAHPSLSGQFLVLPDPKSVRALFSKLGV